MLNKISNIIESKDLNKIKILILFNSLMFILEFLSIGSIPIFMSILIAPDFLVNKLEQFQLHDLKFYLSNDNIIILFSIFIVSVFTIKSLFLILLTIFQNKFLEKTKVKISSKIFTHYIKMEYIKHLEKEPAELTRKITQDISMLGIYIQQYLTFIREIMALLVILFLVVWSSPKIVFLIVLILSILMILYITKIKKVLDRKSNMNKSLAKKNIKTINEIFGAIKDLKILMKEDEMINYFKSNIKKIENNLFFFQVVEKIPRVVVELLAVMVLTILTITFATLYDNLNSFLPILALITLSIFRFIPAFSSITTAKYYMQISLPFLKSLESVFIEISSINNENNKESQSITNKMKNYKIIDQKFLRIQDLAFKYPGNKESQFEGINFEINKCSIVGIIGETGVGKSTLFNLLLGLLKPSNGTILFKEKNILNDLKEWKRKIGSVSQNVFVLDSSIENNITFNINKEKIDYQKLNRAIKVAQLEKKIKQLPQGLKTQVGNNGVKLSGGERQRLAISRVLYQDPEIIFLDESTNALDAKTEEKILEGIKSNYKDKTIIMIAHRQSLIDYCDKIWRLENGKLLNS
jgi:ATP-binding cassette, subfamily B, bacterial PglK